MSVYCHSDECQVMCNTREWKLSLLPSYDHKEKDWELITVNELAAVTIREGRDYIRIILPFQGHNIMDIVFPKGLIPFLCL